jgi:hypothetical protein
MTKAEEKELQVRIKKDILADLTDMVEKEVARQFKDTKTQRQIKEVSAKVLVNLFKTLTNRSNLWVGGL